MEEDRGRISTVEDDINALKATVATLTDEIAALRNDRTAGGQ